MKKLMKWLMPAMLMLAMMGVPRMAQAKDKPRRQSPSSAIENKGDVSGYIVDGATLQPLENATVRVIAMKADAINGTSGKAGFYSFKAPIGTFRSGFAWGRVLDLSIASVLSGGGKHVNKAINVTQFVLRVDKAGYKPFFGPVPVCKANAGEKQFGVFLAPVVLAPIERPYQSYFCSREGAWHQELPWITNGEVRLMDFSPVAQPGNLLNLRGTVINRFPDTRPEEKPDVTLYIDDGLRTVSGPTVKLFKINSNQLKLKESGTPFQYTFEQPQKLNADLKPCLLRVRFGWFSDAYIAVAVPAEKSTAIAKLVAHLNRGQNDRSVRQGMSKAEFELDCFDKILALWPQAADSIDAYRVLNLQLKEPTRALEIYNRREFKSPVLQTQILWNLGEFDKAMGLARKEKFWFAGEKRQFELIKRIQAQPRDYKARLELLALGQRNEKIKSLAVQSVAAPTTPAEKIDYARLLLLQGKRAEALPILKTLHNDTVFGDKALLLTAGSRFETGHYEEALAHYQTAFAHLPDKPTKRSLGTFDFMALHQHGLLLLRAGQRDKAVEMLARALAQSREDTYSKPSSTFMAFGGREIYTVYTGPSTSSTVGYSYPEAAAAALILEHLAAYQSPGADWMSTAILGSALADAGLRAEGKSLLLKVIAAHPQETYPILALAAVRVQGGDLKEAQAAVQRVLRLNPKNPEALLMEDAIGRALKGRSASLK